MSRVEQIEEAIGQLSPEEFTELVRWITDSDQQHWDDQLERDAAAGKLDRFAEEALRDHAAGRSTKL